jgi:GNAT superfamily N-acetyltransferase
MNVVEVRPVRRADFLAWKELWDGYNAFYGRVGPTALAPEITQMTWLRFFDSYEPVHALVAESTDGILGFAHLLYHRSTIQLGPTCYLQDLFTVENARGRGVGRSLIQAVYAHARSFGSPGVYWLTHESNAAARRVYDKLAQRSGFIEYTQDV